MPKYNANLQDADPDFHPSKMTFREVELKLWEGQDVFWRRCRVCEEAIILRKEGLHLPHMVSCLCRGEGKSRVIKYNWDELQKLVRGEKIVREKVARG